MAKFEELNPGPYTAAMKPSPENLKVYDISKKTELSKPVQIKPGMLAYVQFVLIRKAKLKVRFVVKSGAGLTTESALREWGQGQGGLHRQRCAAEGRQQAFRGGYCRLWGCFGGRLQGDTGSFQPEQGRL